MSGNACQEKHNRKWMPGNGCLKRPVRKSVTKCMPGNAAQDIYVRKSMSGNACQKMQSRKCMLDNSSGYGSAKKISRPKEEADL